jgi:hypothetical protein
MLSDLQMGIADSSKNVNAHKNNGFTTWKMTLYTFVYVRSNE